MRVILEGIDGSGKTTLAKILADKYRLDICHCTQYDPTDYDFYLQSVRKNNIVWDRHTIGELIYPKVFNRDWTLGPESVRLILHHARAIGTKVFILSEDLETIRHRLEERGREDMRILQNLEWIHSEFLFYARGFNIPVISTSKMTLDDIYKLVKN